MDDRPNFCQYHYYEAWDMMHQYIESNLKEMGLLGIFTDYDEFSYLMIKIRANIVAFVQSLHAVADTCSHMLYYSLALDKLPLPLKERGIHAKGVLRLLEQQRDAGFSEYEKMCSLFSKLTNNEDYKYLNALTNTSKHRSIVRPELNESITSEGENKLTLYLQEFQYDGELFKKTNAYEFMRREHDRIQPLTVHIGVELNCILQKLQMLKSTQP